MQLQPDGLGGGCLLHLIPNGWDTRTSSKANLEFLSLAHCAHPRLPAPQRRRAPHAPHSTSPHSKVDTINGDDPGGRGAIHLSNLHGARSDLIWDDKDAAQLTPDGIYARNWMLRHEMQPGEGRMGKCLKSRCLGPGGVFIQRLLVPRISP